jgi:hypothetical protein
MHLFFGWTTICFEQTEFGPHWQIFYHGYEAFVENLQTTLVSRHNHFNALIEKIALREALQWNMYQVNKQDKQCGYYVNQHNYYQYYF